MTKINMEEVKKTKILKYAFILVFFALAIIAVFVNIGGEAQEIVIDKDKLNLYLFYGEECPHCTKEKIFLDKLEKELPEIKVHYFEIWHNKNNADLLAEISRKMDFPVRGVPILIIGNQQISGYGTDNTTGAEIRRIINEYLVTECEDEVAAILGTEHAPNCVHSCEDEDVECIHDCGCMADQSKNSSGSMVNSVNLSILGEVNPKNLSLPVFTFLIAATDGFNPCAMWVLLFLISLLLNMKDKKRMWILGSVFILTSGAVYFMFLALWLELFLFLGIIIWIRLVIGFVALASGELHLYDAYKNRDGGCHVINSEKRKRVFNNLREIVKRKNFILALFGIIALAVAVNLIELLCSAGLPAIYTQVLVLSDLPTWQYYMYFLFYVFVFMLDDMLVFFIAMKTLQMKAVSTRLTRWSGIIGGIIILILGILLLFKPGWIMFG